MSVSAELARLLATEVLGRPDLEPEVLEQTAARLEGLLARVRAMDQNLLAELEPAGGFDPSHPAWSHPVADPAWARLGLAAPGSSGYGAAGRGGTGGQAGSAVPAPAGAPAAPGSGTVEPGVALPGTELGYLSLAEVASRIRRRELGAEEVTRTMLDRVAALQPRLNAFITVTAESALAAARAADAALARGGGGGPLCGVPIALKDLYETAGVRTTGGSRVLADHVPRRDATAWARLRAAGAVLLGKTGTHEFAFGPTNNNPHYGPVRNPWHPDHIPGGSSGGSGAAVAAGAAYLGMGTDTGGSIRIPAAACGTVGLKATYGRVSRYGVLPLSWSLDHAGPLTRTVRDAALVLQVLAGPDPLDHTALAVPPDGFVAAVEAAAAGLKGLRVGIDAAWLTDRIDSGVAAAVQAALRTLRDLGAEVVEVELPPPDTMMLVNRLIALGEAGAYHAGHLQNRAREYGEDVRARVELGQFLLARDYLVGQRLRGELARTVSTVFQQVDLIASPALPVPAPLIGQTTLDWGSSQETVAEALIRMTAPFNVTGHPAISVPCGLTPAGLPAGLQLAGRPLDEATVLRAAAAYEAAAAHPLRPPL